MECFDLKQLVFRMFISNPFIYALPCNYKHLKVIKTLKKSAKIEVMKKWVKLGSKKKISKIKNSLETI